MAHPVDIGDAIIGTMAKSEKNNKLKINLTLRKEQRDKLQQMAALEKRSVSNLIEVMADERWELLVQQQGASRAEKGSPDQTNLWHEDCRIMQGHYRNAVTDEQLRFHVVESNLSDLRFRVCSPRLGWA
jgi:hypothetical protein